MEEYEFSILETRTYECVENVRDYKSELGILYLDDFNEKYLTKPPSPRWTGWAGRCIDS